MAHFECTVKKLPGAMVCFEFLKAFKALAPLSIGRQTEERIINFRDLQTFFGVFLALCLNNFSSLVCWHLAGRMACEGDGEGASCVSRSIEMSTM